MISGILDYPFISLKPSDAARNPTVSSVGPYLIAIC